MTKLGPNNESDEQQFAKFADDAQLKELCRGNFVVARFFTTEFDWSSCTMIDVSGCEVVSAEDDPIIVSQPQPMKMGICKPVDQDHNKVSCHATLPPGVVLPRKGMLKRSNASFRHA